MTAIAQQAIDTIIANTIAVIEGTGSYTGIPGVYSHDELLRDTAPSALLVTATGASGTTGIEDDTRTWAADRWVKTRAPSYWALCISATNAANVGAARKISAWAQATTMLTVGAMPAAITLGDTFNILEGFRHATKGAVDDAAQDRRFRCWVEPGESIDAYGAGNRTLHGELVVALTLDAAGDEDSARRSAWANGEILRNGLLLSAHWEATYTRALFAEGSTIDVDMGDPKKVVVEVRIPILYRVALLFS